jgi:2-dehydro-3-deoxyphosphogluconate aldolase/(4S)-4-hydroxy-2-oxoglutarate aldolase
MNMIQKLYDARIIPVIKITNAADAVSLAKALKRGGLNVLEVTFRTNCAAEAIEKIKKEVSGVTLIAGTVLSIENAEKAVAAGAEAIVAPGLNPDVVKWCIAKRIPVCPGIATASEIEQAMSLGLEFVKFFPAEALGGLKMLKALSAPYSQMRFMPTGGIDGSNISDYLAFDRVVACGGSWMVKENLIKAKMFDEIERLTHCAVERIETCKSD